MIYNLAGSQYPFKSNAEEDKEKELEINNNGQLQFSAEDMERWGMKSGTKLLISQTAEGLLIRKAEHSLTRVYVEPTNACNLNCRTCVRNSWDEPEGFMSMDHYYNLIKGLREVNTLQKVSFWGFGEPLLHPNIVEMVNLAKQLGAKTQIITNALLLDKKKAKGLIEVGLDSLIVSVDGASPQSYAHIRPEAELDLVKHNMDQLQNLRRSSFKNNPEIGIEFVLMRKNIEELRYLRKLATSLGATSIFITNLLPYTEELKDEILYLLSTNRSTPANHSKWWPQIFLPPVDLKINTFEPILELAGYLSSISTPQVRLGSNVGGYCRFVNDGSAVVAWDGEVSPCIPLMHTYSCYIMNREKQFLRYTLGNVGSEDIASIWQSKEFVRFRDIVKQFPFSPCTECGGCDLSDTNEEDCFGNTFPVCGDCLWAKGVIQCP